MKKYHVYPILLIALSSFYFLSFSKIESNWPQFRGAENNMIANGSNYPNEWNDSLNVLWSSELTGEGWSSPIVYSDQVFVTSAYLDKTAQEANSGQQQSPPPQPSTPPPQGTAGNQQGPLSAPRPPDNSFKDEIYRWELTSFDLKTGKELWKQVAYKGIPRNKKHPSNNYACETPVTDGKRIVTYFGMMGVYCYDMGGNLLWQKDLGAYETLNGWGTSSSPVLYNETIYVQFDNEENSFLIALDAATGAEKWKVARDEKTNYSTPVIWKNIKRTELVTLGKYARAYNPDNGTLIWKLDMGEGMSIPSSVYDSQRIYVGKAGGSNKPNILFAVKAGAEGDITPTDSSLVSTGVEWTLRKAPVVTPSPLLYNGLLYVVGSRGGDFTCLDAATGVQIYKKKIENVGACWATPWAQGDMIYFYDEKGVTQVVRAGKEFKLLSKNTLNDKFWASIAITNDAYIFRGVKKLYCVKRK